MMNNTKLQPKLLGFAGHRQVADKEKLAIVIRHEVEMMKQALGEKMIGISSAAAGADLVFLRACVELRIPTIVILPFSEERFSEDFEDQAEWQLAQQLMSVSLVKYIIPGRYESPQAYHVVSTQLLEWADAFLFAWNGQPQKGIGGTGETVADARDTGTPSRIIDTGSLVARWQVPVDESRAAKHGFETRRELLEFLDRRYSGAVH
ncbi:hypothetical protein ACFSSA_02900 [Luteolibacter algae]|uniref:Uncharacterized protein n=1 Tax=Luteolibacter algae TaxID=454151 RepID=A0ABW5D4H7_9BACT